MKRLLRRCQGLISTGCGVAELKESSSSFLCRSYVGLRQSFCNFDPRQGASNSINLRAFTTTAAQESAGSGTQVKTSNSDEHKEKISVTFVDKTGSETSIKVPVGMSMLEAAHENDIELEGACEGSLACSTCHVIVMDEEHYRKLPEPTDEENDMLDLAFGLTETSRLGCQIIAKPELEGLRLALPSATRNFAVDGHVPKPH